MEPFLQCNNLTVWRQLVKTKDNPELIVSGPVGQMMAISHESECLILSVRAAMDNNILVSHVTPVPAIHLPYEHHLVHGKEEILLPVVAPLFDMSAKELSDLLAPAIEVEDPSYDCHDDPRWPFNLCGGAG